MGNQLEEIKKLYALKKTYKIPENPKEGQEQVKLEIKPLTLSEMAELDFKNDMTVSESAKASVKMIAKALEMEEADIEKISFEFMSDLLEAVMSANGMNEEDMNTSGLKNFIEEKKKALNDGKSN